MKYISAVFVQNIIKHDCATIMSLCTGKIAFTSLKYSFHSNPNSRCFVFVHFQSHNAPNLPPLHISETGYYTFTRKASVFSIRSHTRFMKEKKVDVDQNWVRVWGKGTVGREDNCLHCTMKQRKGDIDTFFQSLDWVVHWARDRQMCEILKWVKEE